MRSFYKSSREGPLPFLPALALKTPLPPNSSAAAFLTPSRKHPLSPSAMAGDDAWYPCNTTRAALEARVKGGLLRPITDEGAPEWIVPLVSDTEPNPPPGYVVCFLSFLERGFGAPVGWLIQAILHYYEVELHILNPNSVMQAAVFATVCEWFLGVPPHWNLWLHLFKAEMSSRNKGGEKRPLRPAVARCSSASRAPTFTSGVTCPRRTGGGRTGGSTSETTVGCSRSIARKWWLSAPQSGGGAPPQRSNGGSTPFSRASRSFASPGLPRRRWRWPSTSGACCRWRSGMRLCGRSPGRPPGSEITIRVSRTMHSVDGP